MVKMPYLVSSSAIAITARALLPIQTSCPGLHHDIIQRISVRNVAAIVDITLQVILCYVGHYQNQLCDTYTQGSTVLTTAIATMQTWNQRRACY